MNQRTHDMARAINDSMESPLGKVAWAVSKTIITVLITTLVAVSSGYLKDLATTQSQQGKDNTRQDLAIQALQQLSQSQQKVQDSQGQLLQTVNQQVLHNTDAIEHLKELNLQAVRRQRPGR